MVNDTTIELLIAELGALRVRVSLLEAELSNLRAHEEKRTQADEAPAKLSQGDRVRIINAIKRPAIWVKRWGNIEIERHATVTHTTSRQVWVITNNGTKTWQAHNNVKRLL